MDVFPKFIIETDSEKGDCLSIARVTCHNQIVVDKTKVKGGGWFLMTRETNTKRRLSLAKAKALSIIKWKIILRNNGGITGVYSHPELRNLKHNCGFCERWLSPIQNFGESGCDCAKCEFAKAMGSQCNEEDNVNNLFDQWGNERGGTEKALELTQQILDLIKAIPVPTRKPKQDET